MNIKNLNLFYVYEWFVCMFVPYVYAYVMSIGSMVSHMRCHTHGPVFNISNV